jgi:hypothetical protein
MCVTENSTPIIENCDKRQIKIELEIQSKFGIEVGIGVRIKNCEVKSCRKLEQKSQILSKSTKQRSKMPALKKKIL